MPEFSSMWRKRLACERCRKHKIRCDYATPEDAACVRCLKTGSECIVATASTKKDSTRTANDSHSAPKTVVGKNGSVGAREDESPLKEGINYRLYSRPEVERLYELFLTDTVLQAFDLPPNVFQLEDKYPIVAEAAVYVTALGTSLQGAAERLELISTFASSGFCVKAGLTTRDRVLAYLIVCLYLLPYGDRGIFRLFLLSATINTLNQKENINAPVLGHSGGVPVELLRRAVTMCFAAYLLSTTFSPVQTIWSSVSSYDELGFGNSVDDLDDVLADDPITVAYKLYWVMSHKLVEPDADFTLEQVMAKCRSHLRILGALAVSTDSIYVHLYLLATKIKMLGRVGRWALDHDLITPCFASTVAEAVEFAYSYMDLFTSLNEHQLIPSYAYYTAEVVIDTLFFFQFLAYAGSMDVVVPMDYVVSALEAHWLNLSQKTYTGRQSVVTIIAAVDMAQLKISVYNQYLEKLVVDPGKEGPVYLYHAPRGRSVEIELEICRAELQSLLRLQIPPRLEALDENSPEGAFVGDIIKAFRKILAD